MLTGVPPPLMAAIASSTSRRFWSSLLMSMRQLSSFAASRTFWPFLPIANESCDSSTMTSMCCTSGSTTFTRETLAGLRAQRTISKGSSMYSIMSIFSPRISRMIVCTRIPFMPTQAPTASTLRSRERTAILVRSPASRAHAMISTVLS